MSLLTIHRAGPAISVQDMGRNGTLRLGLSRGGAADRRALLEAAALLGQSTPQAAFEMAGMGGQFTTDAPTRIALTGASMRATLDGAPLVWNATHLVPPGALLDIGPAVAGVYGYLSLAGGLSTTRILGSRAAHLNAGIGRYVKTGDTLPFMPDRDPMHPQMQITPDNRFSGGIVRMVPGPQTALYPQSERERFAATRFRRSTHGNRQGIKLEQDGAAFRAKDQLGIVSDMIVPGDIQMTGDGVPFVLLPECQTIGGYPRIGTVIPADLPCVAQAAPGAILRFEFVSFETSDAILTSEAEQLRQLRAAAKPMLRDPNDISDLLGYQLISGATAGDDLEKG